MTAQPQGFTFRQFKSGQVEIYHHGRLAVTVRGPDAAKFSNADSMSEQSLQMLMARLTGNYKRSNEGRAKTHPRNTR
jgi:hypothetical protein